MTNMHSMHSLFPNATIVGFDPLFKELDMLSRKTVDNYPPHNILRLSENQYCVELAIAGFSEEDITVEVKENELMVTGEKPKPHSEGLEFVHRGISNKKFKKTFRLSEHVHVKDASLDNGILSINLEYVVPEEELPRRIPIEKRENLKPRFLSERKV